MTLFGKLIRDVRVWGIVAAIAITAAIVMATAAQNKTNDIADQARRTADARARESLIADHASCLRGNEFRANLRTFSGHQIEEVFKVQSPGTTRTPEVQRIIDNLIADVKALAAKDIPPIDCAAKTPLPPDLTQAERARLAAAQ